MHSDTNTTAGVDLIAGVLRDANGDWVDEELHDGLKIIAVLSGQLRCQISGEDEQLIRGPSICAVISGRDEWARQVLMPGPPLEFLMVKIGRDSLETQFGCAWQDLEAVFGARAIDRPTLMHRPASKSFRALHAQIEACPLSGWARRLFVCGKALEVTALALSNLGSGQVGAATMRFSSSDYRCLEKARSYLLERLADPPSLPELAAKVGLNTRKLTEGFRAAYGSTVHGLLQEARLAEAHRLLSTGEMSVAMAAYHVGYGPAHFSVAFRRRFGMLPSDLLARG